MVFSKRNSSANIPIDKKGEKKPITIKSKIGEAKAK
jgi:hypothetical protein